MIRADTRCDRVRSEYAIQWENTLENHHRNHRMDGSGDDAVGVRVADHRAVALTFPNLPMAQRSLGCRLHRQQWLERRLSVRSP